MLTPRAVLDRLKGGETWVRNGLLPAEFTERREDLVPVAGKDVEYREAPCRIGVAPRDALEPEMERVALVRGAV